MREAIRVVLADDHEMVRRALGRFLKGHGIEVVAEASSGDEACDAALKLSPDVVMLDVCMGETTGAEIVRRIRTTTPSRVLVMTGLVRPTAVAAEVMRAGARGFVLKTSSTEDLVTAIRRVHAGEVFVDRAMADDVLGHAATPDSSPLSERERQVLALVGTGADNEAVAVQLDISPQTVRTHITNIMKKFKARSRLEVALYAIAEGYVSPSDLKARFSRRADASRDN
jgi:two-component system, NarL family, response regulator LiaR